MEVRVSFTLAEHGRDPENGERYMDALMSVFAEGGPSVAQNVRTGTLTTTFSLDADDVPAATRRAVDIFVKAATLTGLPVTSVLDIEASGVTADGADDLSEQGALAPA